MCLLHSPCLKICLCVIARLLLIYPDTDSLAQSCLLVNTHLLVYNPRMAWTKAAIEAQVRTPGRCRAIDLDGKRCRTTWQDSRPNRQFCNRCRARLLQQRHRARAKSNRLE